ncbi:MAG TPA: thioredoxin [Nitrososphaeraceae archaeon]|jgi:thioredoxin 1|nr:thioredoxin [Nitrososphaeraceae archaeon]
MSGSNDEEIKVIKQRKMAELQKALTSKTTMSSIREPIMLTDSNFKNELSKYPILLIDFWAPWCGPCKMISPIIEQLAREYTGKVVFGKVNIDENRMITQSFGIQSIPTMIIFKNGKAVDIIVGAIPKAQLETRLHQQLLVSDK